MVLVTEQYAQIGRAVHRLNPELAETILSIVTTQNNSLCYNIANIDALFDLFCSKAKIKKSAVAGVRNGREAVYKKHIFIAAITKIYNPSVLIKGIYAPNMKKGLRVKIAEQLGVPHTWVSHALPTIATRLKVYPDFMDDVESAVALFKKYIKGL